jgi:hypothetical protein
MQHRKAHQTSALRDAPPLCNDCIHFERLQFTVGRCCRKHLIEDAPSITDERCDSRRCGLGARHFILKKGGQDVRPSVDTGA